MPPGESTQDVVFPQLGESVAEGTILRWLKAPGDAVQADENLVEVSTDKVDTEIPSPASGRVAEILVEEGETVDVGTVLARLAISPDTADEAGPGAAGGAADEPLHFEDSTIDLWGGSGAAAGRGAGTGGKEPGREARGGDPPPPPRSTPAVRRLAKEHGIDLATVRGTGGAGRVTRQDVLDHLASAADGGEIESTGEAPTGDVRPLSPVRRVIARRMAESWRTIPHVTTVVEADLTAIDEIRAVAKAAFEERHGVPLTYLPFLLRATVAALSSHPVFNASFGEDGIRYHTDVHLGLAVATDTGLVVPVLRDAGERTLPDLARGLADLSGRARSGDLEPDDVRGGTFTVTNHGRGGSLLGTPIIVPPQTAILGVGRIADVPCVVEGEIVVRTRCLLSLSFDHRAADGAEADRFLVEIAAGLAAFTAREVDPGGGPA